MTATLSSRGQLVIPQSVRKRCRLREGDRFLIDDNPETQVVILRKITQAGNWFETYMQCPYPFELQPRRRQRRQFYLRKILGKTHRTC